MNIKYIYVIGIKSICALFLLCFLCGCKKQESEQTIQIGVDFEQSSEILDGLSEEVCEEEAQKICVHVCGYVKSPGLYELDSGSRVADAIAISGGFLDGANEDYLNLAQQLKDGVKLYVPSLEEAPLAWEPETADSKAVNINRADVNELCTLSGIGESRAKDIISFRETNGEFKNPEDIMKVPGIKESVYMKIKDNITTN